MSENKPDPVAEIMSAFDVLSSKHGALTVLKCAKQFIEEYVKVLAPSPAPPTSSPRPAKPTARKPAPQAGPHLEVNRKIRTLKAAAKVAEGDAKTSIQQQIVALQRSKKAQETPEAPSADQSAEVQ
jgi:hypothetical protein